MSVPRIVKVDCECGHKSENLVRVTDDGRKICRDHWEGALRREQRTLAEQNDAVGKE